MSGASQRVSEASKNRGGSPVTWSTSSGVSRSVTTLRWSTDTSARPGPSARRTSRSGGATRPGSRYGASTDVRTRTG